LGAGRPAGLRGRRLGCRRAGPGRASRPRLEEQTATTREINRNVTDASTGTQQVAREADRMASATDGMAVGASDAQLAIEELARMVAHLHGLVAAFQL